MTLQLDRRHLVLLATLPVILLNLTFGNVHGLAIPWNIVVAFCLLLLPGLLILQVLKILMRHLTSVVYAAGLSILYLMALGLVVNSVVPLFGDHHPLSHGILLIAYDATIVPLLLTSFIRSTTSLTLVVQSLKTRFFVALFGILFLPALAILGATRLNNGGSNVVSLITIAVVASAFIYYAFRSNRRLVPLFIYIAGVVMLYLFTFRSNFITGSDIVKEFRYFSTTYRQQSWHIDTTSNPYEACLSVTILPTVLANFFHINLQYLYKCIFPLMYGLIPLIVYELTQRVMTRKVAVLASLFFISFSGFISVIPQHSREGIGLIFFGLLVLVLFDTSLSRRLKLSLALSFGFAMAVSHYSTAYLAVPLFGLAYLSSYLLKFIAAISKRHRLQALSEQLRAARFYSGILCIVVGAFTFLWFTQATATSNNISTVSRTLFVNLNSEYGETKYSFADQLNIFYKPDQTQTLTRFITSTTQSDNPQTQYYPATQTVSYKPLALSAETVPYHFGSQFSSFMNLFGSVLKIGLQLLMLIGVGVLLKSIVRKRPTALPPEYFFLSLAAVIIFGATFVLPLLSASYGQDRIYIQLLLFLSVCSVSGALACTSKFMSWAIVPLYILYFLFYSGFLPYLAGGAIPNMPLANYGTEYDAIFTRKQEVVAAQWLEAQAQAHTPILADVYGSAKIVASTKKLNPTYVGIIVPSTIPVRSYVYVTETNLNEGIGAAYPKGSVLQYNFPNSFLNNQKNLVYSDGGSEIFR
jgi:uncharacterized membrane protein